MRISGVPFGFFSGGVGTITCRSGCWRAAASAAVAARAAAALRAEQRAARTRAPPSCGRCPRRPMNAYAWATRPLSSARRQELRARAAGPASASSATQELLDQPRGACAPTSAGVRRGVDDPHALGLGALDLEIAAAHAPVERERLALEVIEPAPRRCGGSPSAGSRSNSSVRSGQHAAGRLHVQLADRRGIDAAPRSPDRRRWRRCSDRTGRCARA